MDADFFPCDDASCPLGVSKSDHELGIQFCDNGHYVSSPSKDIPTIHLPSMKEESVKAVEESPKAYSPEELDEWGWGEPMKIDGMDDVRKPIEEAIIVPHMRPTEPIIPEPKSSFTNSETFEHFMQTLSDAVLNRAGSRLSEYPKLVTMMQMVMNAHKDHYVVDSDEVVAFINNFSEKWQLDRIYFKGDILHRQSISGTRLELVAQTTHAEVHPLVSFLDDKHNEKAAWCILIYAEDDIVLHAPGRPPSPMLATLSSDEQVAVCRGCSAEHLVPDLLYEKRDPERGICDLCRSLEFFVDLSDGNSNREGTMIYDRRSNCFMQTYETTTERLDVELLWKAYLETGEMDVSKFLSDEIKFTSFDFNDLLRLELSLHRSSAELYSALRSIDLSSKGSKLRQERALLKLKMLHRELLDLSGNL
jgi:hypothetical protein